jgi:hypothetical protein
LLTPGNETACESQLVNEVNGYPRDRPVFRITMKCFVCLLLAGLLLPGVRQGTAKEDSLENTSQVSVKAQPRGDTPRVDLHLSPLEGNVTLRIPELISDSKRRLVYSETNLKQVKWSSERDGAISSTWRQDGLAGYRLDARPEPDGLLITWTITNLESHDWSSAAGTVCMQSHGVPLLHDSSGTRTFLRGGGRWISVVTTWQGPGGNWYLPPGKGILEIMRPYVDNGSWKISDFHPEQALIAVTSRDEKWILAQAWHQARYTIANIHDQYACTDVCPDLGEIAAGETVQVQGKIYFFRGRLDDLESRYTADVASNKIHYYHHFQ